MAQNYVEIKIKASDTAKPDLTELKAQLDELGRKDETAKVSIDDKDSEAKLLRLNAQLAALNKKVNAKRPLDVAGAAKAQADVAALGNEFDKLQRKADEFLKKAGPQGLLSKLLYGSSGSGGIAGIAGSIGGIGGSIKDAGGGGLLSNPYSLAAVAAGVTALLPELLGLASGFTAAGAGAGAFYLLAHPAISNLTQDTQNLLAAEEKLQAAQNKYTVDPTKANAKAVQTAVDNLKAVQMSMGQDAGGAAAGIAKLRTEYDKLATAFQPDVFKVFNAGLKVMNNLLPDVTPFAKTFADTMTGLFGQLAAFTSDSAASNPVKKIHESLTFLKQAAGLNWEQILNPDGLKSVKVKLSDQLNFEQLLNPAGMKRGGGGLNWEQLLNPAGMKPALTPFQQFLDQLHRLEGPSLKAIGDGLGKVAGALGKLLTTMSAKDVVNAINIAFTVLADTITVLTVAIKGIMRAWDVSSKTIARDSREVASAFDALRHDIANFAHNIASYFDEARANVARWALDVQRDADNVVKWFQRLPGKILAALGALPGMLFKAGQAAISGLLRGMESMMGGALHTVEGWGHDLLNALGSPFGIHFSEPSEATQVIKAGQNIARGLGTGMLSGQGGVAAAAARLAGSAAGGLAGGTGAGGGQLVIQIHPGGGGSGLEAQFWSWLKNGVRAQGGDPRMFNKKVAFQ